MLKQYVTLRTMLTAFNDNIFEIARNIRVRIFSDFCAVKNTPPSRSIYPLEGTLTVKYLIQRTIST